MSTFKHKIQHRNFKRRNAILPLINNTYVVISRIDLVMGIAIIRVSRWDL